MANKRTQQIEPGRMTKAERKEAARRERLEIQRRMARARRNRWIALGVAVVVAAGVTAFVLTRPKPKQITPGALLAGAPSQARASGCSVVKDVGPYQPQSLDQKHIGVSGGPATMPALSTYPSAPPASGPHNPNPLNSGVYASPPPIDQAIHSLEHGATIVWYAPGASGDELARIQSFYRKTNVGSRVIVAPYDYPDQGAAGSLPAGVQMALVAWHHVETCASVNLAAAFDFTARYSAPTFGQLRYLGDAPEAGAAI